MSAVALIALVCYALVTIGWRAWLQKRRTGDAGLRAGPRTRAEWLAGAGLVLGAIAVYAAPALDLAGSLAPVDAFEGPLARAAGVAGLALGFWLTVRAQLDMGESWRIGVDAGEVNVEEPYLLAVHGDRYRRYASSAGRFVPRVGRVQPG